MDIQMKTLGLIGGTSWHSTIDYYRYINEMANERRGPKFNPPLLIYSLNQAAIHALQQADRWDQIAEMYVAVGQQLINAGAQGLMFCANTPHKIYDTVQDQISVPVLHIADATGVEAHRHGFHKMGLLGTKFTMEGKFIGGRLTDRYQIEVIRPDADTRTELHRIIFDELCHGDFNEKAKAYVLAEIVRMHEAGAEGVVLGCTEFPILVKQSDTDIPLFDTTRLHAKMAVDFMLGR